jgi:hypothetical protein
MAARVAGGNVQLRHSEKSLNFGHLTQHQVSGRVTWLKMSEATELAHQVCVLSAQFAHELRMLALERPAQLEEQDSDWRALRSRRSRISPTTATSTDRSSATITAVNAVA